MALSVFKRDNVKLRRPGVSYGKSFFQPPGNRYRSFLRERQCCGSPGTVTISTYSYSAGNYVMIHHGGDVYTVYMHCSELLVSSGQDVLSGQVIAKVGSTGYLTGPHLHFGIRVNGSYVNPAKYVSP